MLEEETTFTCPYCGEDNSIVIDLSIGGQELIEDCVVCCSPMEIRYKVEDGEVASFGVDTTNS